MSSKNSNPVSIRNDRSVNKSDKVVKKVNSIQSSSKPQKSFIDINKSNIGNTVVKRDYISNKNPFANKSIKQANLKQVSESESRTILLDKVKFLEQELERYVKI